MQNDTPMPRDAPSLQFRAVSLDLADGRRPRLSLQIAPGEFVSVLGATGVVGTRLLMLAAGLTDPAGGQVLVDGKSPRLQRRAGRLGIMLRPDALFPHLTVRQNIAYPLAASGRWGSRLSAASRSARREQVRLVAALLKLEPLLRRYPASLDITTRRRVSLARAVVGEPTLLLLDEPLAGLALAARDDLQQTLRRLHDWLGATTLAAIGEPAQALALSDQVAVLSPGGGIAQLGSPAELHRQPANAAVAAVLGPANRLAGRIEQVEVDIAQVRLDCGPLVEAQLAEPDADAKTATQPGPSTLTGAACTLVVPPERIAVAAISPEEMGDETGAGAIAATVVEALDLGVQLQLRLLIGTGSEIVVLRPAAAGLGGLAPGRVACIAFQPHHALVFTR